MKELSNISIENAFTENTSNLFCPICNTEAPEFKPFGVKPRPNAQCPTCKSLERHRLLWLFLQQHTNLFTTPHLKMLDVAPSPCLSEKIQQIPDMLYLSIDLNSRHAMRKMDLTNLQLPDDHFDCILCHHVLEHIPDDKKAMQELLRVLKPGGWAIIQVPLRKGTTHEGAHISDPAERTRLFGQQDHLRYYGTDDYQQKLEAQGFKVQVIPFAKDLSDTDVKRYSLHVDEDIYFCTKR